MRLFHVIFVVLSFIIIPNFICVAQKDSLYVSGNALFNECDEQLILNGVNYSVLDDWNFPSNLYNGKEKLEEIAKSGANAVRIEWYNNYNQKGRAPYTTSDLDSLLTRCNRLHLIPIVGLWDLTCDTNWVSFDTLITKWWTRPENIALINKHKSYMIVNICNEFAQYEWTGDTTKALLNYKTNYNLVVSKLRKAGIHVPLLIDAPDCGQNVECVSKCGKQIIAADPLKNILFGVHAYWYFYTKNDSVQTTSKINEIINSKIPVVFGEIANYQSINNSNPCQYVLDYPTLLRVLNRNKLGWLSWAWYEDYCNLREMTDSGNYSKLSMYGNDIVNNSVYGLKTSAVKKSCSFPPNHSLPIFNCSIQQITTINGQYELKLDYNFEESVRGILQISIDGINWQDEQRLSFYNNSGKLIITSSSLLNEKYCRVKIITTSNETYYSNQLIIKNTSTAKLNVFPNPARNTITLTSLLNNSEILIYSVTGKIVLSKMVSFGSATKLDISSLSNGFYFIKNANSIGQNQEITFYKE